jgi:protoporphyrinogen IX oxidase
MPNTNYDFIKALHLIFMVSWFAGLFYMVRLFIYFREAADKPAVEKEILQKQFVIMMQRLWWIITTPAMVLTVVFGIWMLALNPAYLLHAPWMHLKLGFVVLLLIYHFYSQKLLRNGEAGQVKWSSNQLRIWNEVATLLLVIIVFLVVLKNHLNWISGTIGFFGVGVALMLGIKLYKKLRKTQA